MLQFRKKVCCSFRCLFLFTGLLTYWYRSCSFLYLAQVAKVNNNNPFYRYLVFCSTRLKFKKDLHHQSNPLNTIYVTRFFSVVTFSNSVCSCSVLNLILLAGIKEGSSNWYCYFNFRTFVVMQLYHIFTLLVLLNGMDIFAKEYFVEALINTFILYHKINFSTKINLSSVWYLCLMYFKKFSFFSNWKISPVFSLS